MDTITNNLCVQFCLLILTHINVTMVIKEYCNDIFTRKIVYYNNLGIFVNLPSVVHSQEPF